MELGPTLTLADIRALAGMEASPTISAFLPTHVAGRETAQDPIRLRNLLDRALTALVDAGCRRAEVRRWLEPAHSLVEDASFWRHQDRGLALFAMPDRLIRARLPAAMPERLVAGRRPHLRPLLRLLRAGDGFHILAAGVDGATLYAASRHGCRPVEAGLPDGVGSVVASTEYEHSHHAAPPARPRAAPGIQMVGAQIFGDSPEEARKAELTEYARRLDHAVAAHLAGDDGLIVLVAQPELQGHLRKLTPGLDFVDGGLEADPGSMSPDELHRRAFALVRPLLDEAAAGQRERLAMLLGSGDPRALTDLEAILVAAHDGRVRTLLVDPDALRPGTFHPDRRRVTAPESGVADELVDLAVTLSLRHGGTVELLGPDLRPTGDPPAAAILRY